jgi:hypothetical protein
MAPAEVRKLIKPSYRERPSNHWMIPFPQAVRLDRFPGQCLHRSSFAASLQVRCNGGIAPIGDLLQIGQDNRVARKDGRL